MVPECRHVNFEFFGSMHQALSGSMHLALDYISRMTNGLNCIHAWIICTSAECKHILLLRDFRVEKLG